MISYANSRKIYTIISTNGYFLDEANARKTIESGLKQLTISLDGTNKESYLKYRQNGDYDQIIEGVKNIVRLKKELSPTGLLPPPDAPPFVEFPLQWYWN